MVKDIVRSLWRHKVLVRETNKIKYWPQKKFKTQKHIGNTNA